MKFSSPHHNHHISRHSHTSIYKMMSWIVSDSSRSWKNSFCYRGNCRSQPSPNVGRRHISNRQSFVFGMHSHEPSLHSKSTMLCAMYPEIHFGHHPRWRRSAQEFCSEVSLKKVYIYLFNMQSNSTIFTSKKAVELLHLLTT